MKKIIDNYTYLSIKEISAYTGILERKLQRCCKKNKYIYRIVSSVGRNGKKYEILFSSLEKELQEKIHGNLHYSDMGAITIHNLGTVSTAVGSSSNSFEKEIVPDNAKKIALSKVDIINIWTDYRNEKTYKKSADKEFITAFNNCLISKKLLDTVGKISIGSLYRWKKTYEDNNKDFYSLINNYKYSGEYVLSTSLSDEEKQEFIKLYYNDARLDLSTAYNLLKYKFKKLGKAIKSEATFRRFAKHININHYDFEVLAREGEKALKDKVVPSIRRDISFLQVGDILVADGNKLDFMIINPFTGKPSRAILVVFQDWYSKDFVGYEIMLSENTQCISSALRNAIIRLGKFPKVVYMDNGRAFRGEYFTGCNSFEDSNFKGIYANLGIKTVFAKPYNGKAKIVERSFGEFVKSCPPLISSYIGSSISKQPAHLKRNEKFHKEIHKNDKIPTIEQAKLIIEEWLKYYRSQLHKTIKNKTIDEVFNAGKGTGINIDMLDELMMKEEIRTLRRSTIKFLGHEYTGNNLYGINDKVVVKYSLFDISKLKIYSLKGEYIGEAETVIKYNAMAKYFGSANDIYTLKQAQKQQNKFIKDSMKKTKTLMGKNNPFDDLPWAKNQDVIQIEEKREKKKKYEITGYENAHLYLPKKQEYFI